MAFGAATAQAFMVSGMVTASSGDGQWGAGHIRCHSLVFQGSVCQDPRSIHWFGAFQFPSSPGVAEWPHLGLINVVGMSVQGSVAGKGRFPNSSS